MAVQETARAGLGLLLAVPKNINSIFLYFEIFEILFKREF
jgi:hypothetical protein